MPSLSKSRLVELNDAIQTIQELAETERRELTAGELDEINDLYQEFRATDTALTLEGYQMQPRQAGPQNPSPQNQPTAINPPGRLFQARTGDTGGFGNFGHFAAALCGTLKGQSDSRLIMASGMNEGTGAEGGFLVPTQFATGILGPAFVESGVLSRVNQVPMTSASLKVGGFSTTDHTSGAIGGITMNWSGEGTQLSTQTATLKELNLTARKGTILIEVTNELLFDAPQASAQLQEIFRMAAQYGLEKAILTGDGVGKPQGLLNADSLIEVAKEGSQVADTILYANCIKMLARLHPALLAGAVWVANPNCLPQLLNLQFLIENAAASDNVGGSQVPFLTDQTGQYRLLGIPVVFSESLPVVGDAGDLVLANFNEFYFGMRQDVVVDVSPHLKFDYDMTVFRLKVRADGLSRWSEAATPENGDTLSWAVSLAERA